MQKHWGIVPLSTKPTPRQEINPFAQAMNIPPLLTFRQEVQRNANGGLFR
jgi:hypothetical protein